MKKVLLVMVSVIFASVACSQKLSSAKVPQTVKEGLKRSHPVVSPAWEMEDGNYEANFHEKGKAVSCVIDKGGTILETETVIPHSQLPVAARTYVSQHYPKSKIREIAMIEKNGGEKNFEVVIPGKELVFDSNGNFKEVEKQKKGKM